MPERKAHESYEEYLEGNPEIKSFEKAMTFYDFIIDQKYVKGNWEDGYFPEVEKTASGEAFIKVYSQIHPISSNALVTNVYILCDKRGVPYKIPASGFYSVCRTDILIKLSFRSGMSACVDGKLHPTTGKILPIADLPVEYIVDLSDKTTDFINKTFGQVFLGMDKIGEDGKPIIQAGGFEVIEKDPRMIQRLQPTLNAIPKLLNEVKIPGVQY